MTTAPLTLYSTTLGRYWRPLPQKLAGPVYTIVPDLSRSLDASSVAALTALRGLTVTTPHPPAAVSWLVGASGVLSDDAMRVAELGAALGLSWALLNDLNGVAIWVCLDDAYRQATVLKP